MAWAGGMARRSACAAQAPDAALRHRAGRLCDAAAKGRQTRRGLKPGDQAPGRALGLGGCPAWLPGSRVLRRQGGKDIPFVSTLPPP